MSNLNIMFVIVFRQRCEFRQCAAKNKKVRQKHSRELSSVQRMINKLVAENDWKEGGIQVVDPRDVIPPEASQVDEVRSPSEITSDESVVEESVVDESVVDESDVDESVKSLQPSGMVSVQEKIPKYSEPATQVSVDRSQQLYSCAKCGKRFSKKCYAVSHCRPKPVWKCEECNEEIKQSCNVQRHKRRCKIKKNLNVQEKAHIDLKCDQCERKFTTWSNVLRHKK